MAFLHSVTPVDFLNSLVSLFVAFALGAVIGAERQYRQRSGGLRTNALVAVGAATFVDVGMHLNSNPGATQVIAYVVSGIGFLGADVIMKEGRNVWGLNTAATLWCSAAVGACAGADLAIQAVALTGFVLAGNTLLRPIVNAINRLPILEHAMEATYEVRLSTDADHLEIARENLEGILEQSNYALRDIDVIERDPPSIEIVATLAASSADPLESVAIETADAADSEQITAAFTRFSSASVEGIVVTPDSVFNVNRSLLAQLALKSRMPSMFPTREYVEAGGLLSYGESLRESAPWG